MSSASHVLTGPEEDYEIPEESIGKYIFDSLKRRDPTEVIKVDAITGDVLTCGNLLESSVKLTTILQNLEIKRGDTIAIVSENSLNYCIPVVAGLYMGVMLNPLNPAYGTGELKHGLHISKAKLIICSKTTLQAVLKVKEELDFVETVLLIGPQSEDNPEIKSIDKLLETTVADMQRFAPEEFDYSEQGAFILLSSGTTGLPKGVLLTHKNVRAPLGYMQNPSYGNVISGDVTVQILPYFHVFGLLLQLVVITAAMKAIVMVTFKPEIFLKSIQDHKVTKLFVVPPLLLFLAKSPLVGQFDVSSIKDILVGAAPVGKELQNEAKKRLGDVTIRQIYGLTETSGACTFQTRELNKAGSAGILMPGMTAKVWEKDEIVGPNKTGELCFKGPMIMKGYNRNEEATKACIDKDGFFHTGDVGYYDDDKFFFIVERMKELIKYKGFQVPPAELEALIISHSGVKECGVIGIPDERAGQVPLAFVVRQTGANVSEQEIVDFVAERISIQKRLYGGVNFVEEVPKNASGKILRRKLMEIYERIEKREKF